MIALRNIYFFIVVLLIISGLSGCVKLKGVKALMNLGASDKVKEKASAQETESFQRLKAYIENNVIKADMTEDEVAKKVGDPVIVVDQKDKVKWAYKPAYSEWFGGEKIYLFFDKEKRLISWEYVKQE